MPARSQRFQLHWCSKQWQLCQPWLCRIQLSSFQGILLHVVFVKAILVSIFATYIFVKSSDRIPMMVHPASLLSGCFHPQLREWIQQRDNEPNWPHVRCRSSHMLMVSDTVCYYVKLCLHVCLCRVARHDSLFRSMFSKKNNLNIAGLSLGFVQCHKWYKSGMAFSKAQT